MFFDNAHEDHRIAIFLPALIDLVDEDEVGNGLDLALDLIGVL